MRHVLTLGQIVSNISQARQEAGLFRPNERYLLYANRYLNSAIEIDRDTEDLPEPGDLCIKICHCQAHILKCECPRDRLVSLENMI